jgi:hypothetical protein
MPLIKSGSEAAKASNIREMIASGHPSRVAVAAALHTADRYGHADGGGVDSWMMHQASHNLFHEGMIKSPSPGRADTIPMSVPAGSFVMPSDIPSALGQGNSQNDGDILRRMFSSGPGGLPLAHKRPGYAQGGYVPIQASGGEFVIAPDVVKDVGHGDLNAGHKVLTAFVLKTRKAHIEQLKRLKAPKA